LTYIKRNENGEIISVHKDQSDEHEEYLEDSNVELKDFLMKAEQPQVLKGSLSSSDREMVRVIDDLINLLIEKQVFVFTELPEAVQAKLNTRSTMRSEMNPLGDLVGDGDEIF